MHLVAMTPSDLGVLFAGGHRGIADVESRWHERQTQKQTKQVDLTHSQYETTPVSGKQFLGLQQHFCQMHQMERSDAEGRMLRLVVAKRTK